MGLLSRLLGRKKPQTQSRTARIAPPHMEPRRRPVSQPTRRPSHVNDDEITTSALLGHAAATGDFDYDGVPDYAERHQAIDDVQNSPAVWSDSSSSDSSSSSGSGSSYSSGSDSSYSSGSDSSSYDSGSSGGFDSSSF